MDSSKRVKDPTRPSVGINGENREKRKDVSKTPLNKNKLKEGKVTRRTPYNGF